MDIFACAGIKLFIEDLFPGPVDVMDRAALKPYVRVPATPSMRSNPVFGALTDISDNIELAAELKARHPEIARSEIAAAGSVYRHAYQLVRDDILWQTVESRLEPLLKVIESELAQITER